MDVFGLIGFSLEHSFSETYFLEKFAKEGITNATFRNFILQDISHLPSLIASQPEIKGLAVTIPHKSTVLPLLDELDATAEKIGAVNCIQIINGHTKGFNTDVIGFENSFIKGPLASHSGALVLGSGGSSRAVVNALNKLGIPHKIVSRRPAPHVMISYSDLNKALLDDFSIVINCTPVGMYPDVNSCPAIPYELITERHFLFDLVYNPAETEFLRRGRAAGAIVMNGLEMLKIQAEENWRIWNADKLM